MRNVSKQSRLFMKYLLSYIFLLLIPVIIMGFFMYNYFVGILKAEVVSNTMNSLNKSKYTIDEQVIQLRNISFQAFNLNKNLKPVSLLMNDALKAIKVKDELYNYTAANNFINEVVLYFRGDNYIYTSRGSYTIPTFTKNVYCYKNWSGEDFHKDITTLSEPVIRPAEEVNESNERFITFIYPFTHGTGDPYESMLFIIKEKTLHQLLKNNIKGHSENSMVFDEKNRMITAIKEDAYLHSEEFLRLVGTVEGQVAKISTLGGKKFFVCIVTSDETRWKYVALYPVNLVMQQVERVQLLFIYGIALIFLFGSAFIYLSMNVNYKPLKQLRLYSEKIVPDFGKPLNELESVRQTLDFLSVQNSELSDKLKNNLTALKDFLIFSVLKGKFGSVHEFNEKGKEIGVVFTKALFWAVIIKVHTGHNNSIKGNIISAMENCKPEGFDCYGRDYIEPHEFILVFSSDPEREEETCEKLKLFQGRLKEQLGAPVTMGAGNRYEDLSLLPKSYIEASTALKHRFVKGNDQVIFFHEIGLKQYRYNEYPSKEIAELRNHILQGNSRKVGDTLQSIIDTIKKDNTPLFIVRGIFFDVITMISQTSKEIGYEFVMTESGYPDIFLLETLDTVENFNDLIKHMCTDICASIQARKEVDSMRLIDQIILFIRQKYDDCNFSIQDIADHFQMNLSYLSQYFKLQTNQTILEYITALRMEKAKKLLLTSELSLKYIAEETGYYNVSSFIRRFKQVAGVTPGDYRSRSGETDLVENV